MSSPFVAEIRMFGFTFPPRGWAACDGQLLPISQNTALFSLLGTVYGGDGKSDFALPNLQGSIPVHAGQGPGLSAYSLGQMSGSETVTLLQSEIPSHSHALNVSQGDATDTTPANQTLAAGVGVAMYAPRSNNQGNLDPTAVAVQGGDQPHNNLQPYLVLNFCIAMQGVFPPRP